MEIAIRALSPAVNDTFTGLTCIDWLAASLCRLPPDWQPVRTHRDRQGYIRVITIHVSHARLVQRAFDKVRQAGRGMPAVMIRQLDALTRIAASTSSERQREVLLRQAAMIERAVGAVPEPSDRADARRAHRRLLAVAEATGAPTPAAGRAVAPSRTRVMSASLLVQRPAPGRMDVSEPASGLALYIYRLALGDWLVSEVGYANEGHGEDLRALHRLGGCRPASARPTACSKMATPSWRTAATSRSACSRPRPC